MTKLTTEDKATIAKDTVAGIKQRELAKRYNVSQKTISVCLSDKEQRDIIKAESARIVAMCPQILNKWTKEIGLADDIVDHIKTGLDKDNKLAHCRLDTNEEYLQFLKYVQKHEELLLKSTGMLPTQTTNLFIGKVINNTSNNQIINAGALKALGLGVVDDHGVDDVEANEEEEVVDVEFEAVDDEDKPHVDGE